MARQRESVEDDPEDYRLHLILGFAASALFSGTFLQESYSMRCCETKTEKSSYYRFHADDGCMHPAGPNLHSFVDSNRSFLRAFEYRCEWEVLNWYRTRLDVGRRVFSSVAQRQQVAETKHWMKIIKKKCETGKKHANEKIYDHRLLLDFGLFCIKVVGANFIPTDKAKSDLVKANLSNLAQISMLAVDQEELENVSASHLAQS